MTTEEIWMLPKHERFGAFIERYLDLDEMTGNRTLAEKDEMLEIATAVMPELIRTWQRTEAPISRGLRLWARKRNGGIMSKPEVIRIPSIGPRIPCPHCGHLAASDGSKTTFCANCGRSIKSK